MSSVERQQDRHTKRGREYLSERKDTPHHTTPHHRRQQSYQPTYFLTHLGIYGAHSLAGAYSWSYIRARNNGGGFNGDRASGDMENYP